MTLSRALKPRRAAAFTLIEVLIVVVIMAVLAAAAIPTFSTSTKDAREATLRTNLQILRNQLQTYKHQHVGTPPAGVNDLEQLTKASDAHGAVSMSGLPDATHPYGPYLQGGMPTQPFSGLSAVKLDNGAPGTQPTATAAPGGGWIYRPTTGEVWVDHPDYLGW